MMMVVLAVRDKATEAFGRPMFVLARGQGVRSFSDEVNRKAPDNSLNQHPEDYSLWELGSYDDSSAKFTLLPEPRKIADGLDVSKGE